MEGDDSAASESAWSVHGREEVYRAMKWRVERSMRSLDGCETLHEFHTVELPDFVNVVPITENKEVLMVRQYRHGIERNALEFPGGLVDGAEHHEQAARRELLEETGHDGEAELIGELWPNPAMMGNRLWVYTARVTYLTDELELDATEDIRLVHVPFASLGMMASDGRIRGAMQVAIVHLMLAHRG